jgi:hypothetical protein
MHTPSVSFTDPLLYLHWTYSTAQLEYTRCWVFSHQLLSQLLS